MTTALAERPSVAATAIEQALIGGDLSKLTPGQRVSYYNSVCASLELNPLTKPFAYITLNGKLTLYALKDCTEQLRHKRTISVTIVAREVVEDCYIVTARATTPQGRQDESIGAVPLAGLKGEARANAMMKAETKAKRRVTLSICGLGMLDETEVDSIPHGGYSVEPAPAPVSVVPPAASPRNDRDASRPGPVAPPLDVSELPEGQPASGALTIMRVDVKDTKNPNVKKHTVILSDGREVSTIKSQLASLAEQVCQEGAPITVETKTTKWGEDLLAIHRVSTVIEATVEECAACGMPLYRCACDSSTPF